VGRALAELSACQLLDQGPAPVERLSRREMARRLAGVGGAALGASLIYAVAIPTAAAAAGSVCPITVTGRSCLATYNDAGCTNGINYDSCETPGCSCQNLGQCIANGYRQGSCG